MGLEQTQPDTTVIDDIVKKVMVRGEITVRAMAEDMGYGYVDNESFWQGVHVGVHLGFIAVAADAVDMVNIKEKLSQI